MLNSSTLPLIKKWGRLDKKNTLVRKKMILKISPPLP
jgi:hypothetical protein